MKNKALKLLPIWTFILLSLSSLPKQNAQANEDVEEVTYDDLIQRISEKKAQLQLNSDRQTNFDNLMIHAGFGLVSSVSSLNIDGKESLKSQNGFQISLGIDLFSENFVAEGALRNFGQSSSATETRSLREFDLKLSYYDKFESHSGFHIGSGVGTRIFKLSDPASGTEINDTTPSILLAGGLDTAVSRTISLGVELGWRTSLITTTVDKNGLDATLRLDTSF